MSDLCHALPPCFVPLEWMPYGFDSSFGVETWGMGCSATSVFDVDTPLKLSGALSAWPWVSVSLSHNPGGSQGRAVRGVLEPVAQHAPRRGPQARAPHLPRLPAASGCPPRRRPPASRGDCRPPRRSPPVRRVGRSSPQQPRCCASRLPPSARAGGRRARQRGWLPSSTPGRPMRRTKKGWTPRLVLSSVLARRAEVQREEP